MATLSDTTHGPQDQRVRRGEGLLSCDLVVYLQQMFPGAYTTPRRSAALDFLERELRFPTGAIPASAPDIRFSMVAFSPDCGYVLESKGPPDYTHRDGEHLTGLKLEVFYIKSRREILGLACVLSAQIFVMIRQMRESSTPSTRSRISFYTIALLSLSDRLHLHGPHAFQFVE